ncbi:MAG: serine/threonine protein kinase, partial [Candidatus Riflebacteria bacterium]|nr:serine/threonine protein kinase [Candidatus Riflebacteria bacterium]
MGQYKLLGVLGEGAMGTVYRALQMPLEREVAIKFMKSSFADKPDVVKRFRREVAGCIRLAHPNVIKIIDSGEENGRLYYVMEFLSDCKPLDEVLKKEGRQPIPRAFEIAIQLLDALGYCHSRDTYHLDVKPANVMIGADNHVTLMDFGLIKDLNATMLTEDDTFLGTPAYAPPESFTSALEASPAMDIWPVGVILYEMVTGEHPFVARNLQATVASIMRRPLPSVTGVDEALPSSLDPVLRRFVEKEPSRRVPSASEAIQMLRDWLAHEQISVTLHGDPAPPPPGSAAVRATRTSPEGEAEGGLGGGMSEAKGPPSRTIPPGSAAERATRTTRPSAVAGRETGRFAPAVTAAAPTPGGLPRWLWPVAIVGAVALAGGAPFFIGSPRPASVASPSASVAAPASRGAPAPVEVVRRLLTRLRKLDPLTIQDRMLREFSPFARARRPTAEQALAVARARRRWSDRIAAVVATCRAREAIDEFGPLKDQVYLSSSVSPQEKI